MPQVIPITLTPIPVPNSSQAVNLSQLVALVAQYLGAQIQQDVSFFLDVTSDPVTDQGVIIYNSTQNVFKAWSTTTGNYQPVGFLIVPLAPNTNQGVIFNSSTNLFMAWNASALAYQPLALIPSASAAPAAQTLGAMFYNSTNLCLMQWNAAATPPAYQAIGLYYAATDPLANVGTVYNTTINQIKYWNTGITPNQYSTLVPLNLSLGDEKTTYVAGDELSQGWVIENGRTISALTGFTATQIANMSTLFGTTLPTRAGSGSPANLYKCWVGFAN